MPVEHAMNRNTVNFQIDEDLKRRFEDVCEAAGLSIQEACMRFAEASVRLNRIPFEASGHGSDAAEKTVTAEAPLAYAATADYFEKDGVPLRFDTKLWFRRPVEGIEPVCVGPSWASTLVRPRQPAGVSKERWTQRLAGF